VFWFDQKSELAFLVPISIVQCNTPDKIASKASSRISRFLAIDSRGSHKRQPVRENMSGRIEDGGMKRDRNGVYGAAASIFFEAYKTVYTDILIVPPLPSKMPPE
jgi:hypothetical protein